MTLILESKKAGTDLRQIMRICEEKSVMGNTVQRISHSSRSNPEDGRKAGDPGRC